MTKRRAKTYFGKVCAKHPDLKGERYGRHTGDCIACSRARNRTPDARARERTYRQTPQYLARQRAYRQSPEYRARNQSVEVRAGKCDRQRARRQNPDYRARQRAYKRAYVKRGSNVQYRLKNIIGNRVRRAVRRLKAGKSASTMTLMGCTLPFFKKYLESLFKEGMTWDNYCYEVWHIDHVRPCASFDLTDPAQQRECFHYSNLQPMWGPANISKGSKWKGSRWRKGKRKIRINLSGYRRTAVQGPRSRGSDHNMGGRKVGEQQTHRMTDYEQANRKQRGRFNRRPCRQSARHEGTMASTGH